jgi:hypothetical protein
MPAGDLTRVWETLKDHGDRIGDVEQSVTELVDTLREPIADWQYAKRRREERQRTRRDWRIWLAAIVGLVVGVDALVSLIVRVHG